MNRNQPILNVVGERIALGPMRDDLLDTYLTWMNDPAVIRTLNQPRQFTRRNLISILESVDTDPAVELFTIYRLSDWQPIGQTALTSIDFRNRTAEFQVVIGEAEARGQGYGTEATRLMLDFAFTVLGLRNVMLKVYEYNLAGINAYLKAGFVEFGRRRQAIELSGKPWDIIYMECLRNEFESPLLEPIFTPDVSR